MDVNAVLYSGCMAAAPQLFDKTVCQQEADDYDDDNVVGDWDPDNDLVVCGGGGVLPEPLIKPTLEEKKTM